MEAVVLHNAKDIEELLKKVPRRFRIVMADGFDHATRSFYSKLLEERLQGPPGIHHNRGGIFHRFRRAVKIDGKLVFLRQGAKQGQSTATISKSDGDPIDMKIEMYTQSKVAGIHETGGVISSGKPMPIPLNDAARAMISAGQSIATLVPMKIGEKIFLGRRRKFGKPELLFMLSRGIRIKARLGFYRTWEAHAQRRNEIMDEAVNKALETL